MKISLHNLFQNWLNHRGQWYDPKMLAIHITLGFRIFAQPNNFQDLVWRHSKWCPSCNVPALMFVNRDSELTSPSGWVLTPKLISPSNQCPASTKLTITFQDAMCVLVPVKSSPGIPSQETHLTVLILIMNCGLDTLSSWYFLIYYLLTSFSSFRDYPSNSWYFDIIGYKSDR